jgi:hypothetical protein
MSSRLSDEIAKLAAHTGHRIHDHDTINALNIVVAYAYLLHFRPQCWEQLRKHLQAFSDLACTRGHLDLRDHSAKIIEMMNGSER